MPSIRPFGPRLTLPPTVRGGEAEEEEGEEEEDVLPQLVALDEEEAFCVTAGREGGREMMRRMIRWKE